MTRFNKKKRTTSRSEEKTPEATAPDTGLQRKWSGIVILSTVIVAILIVVGIFYHRQYITPFRRTIITVDDSTIDMGYFLKRTQLAVADPIKMLEVLVREQLIKREAPRFVGQVTPEEISQELKRIARGQSENITESEAEEWYRQRLNESGLSDAEYREIVKVRILAGRLQEYLAQRVPTVGEQAHLHVIQADTHKEAEKLRARWKAGEDFNDLSREASADLESKEQGGDMGWVALNAFRTGFEHVAAKLNAGEVSEPVQLEPQGPFYLVMVSEKTRAREYAEKSLKALKDRALLEWISQEIPKHDIKYNFNSEIFAWVKWQLSKKSPK